MTEKTVSDQAVRFVFDECAVRGVWVQLDQAMAELLAQHEGYSQAERVLLGESVAASVLLTRTIKLKGRVALQARSEQALRLLVAECTDDGAVRGVVELDKNVTEEQLVPLAPLIQGGYLAVALLPDVGERYQGIVPLDGERIQDCLADYFVRSEQLATGFWLASDGVRAAGLMLQVLPAEERDDDAWPRLTALASTVKPEELLALDAETLLHRLYHEEVVRVFEPQPLRFACTCSRERSRDAMVMLGRDELFKLFAETPAVDIDCQFCNAKYTFGSDDFSDLLQSDHTQQH